ncbi:hypothetical protein OHB54_21255 [Streptomyces sp. NBC_01007]|nr:hypothetical protein OHB54_21255 [Streptomyces sp. NBC_01007]
MASRTATPAHHTTHVARRRNFRSGDAYGVSAGEDNRAAIGHHLIGSGQQSGLGGNSKRSKTSKTSKSSKGSKGSKGSKRS